MPAQGLNRSNETEKIVSQRPAVTTLKTKHGVGVLCMPGQAYPKPLFAVQPFELASTVCWPAAEQPAACLQFHKISGERKWLRKRAASGTKGKVELTSTSNCERSHLSGCQQPIAPVAPRTTAVGLTPPALFWSAMPVIFGVSLLDQQLKALAQLHLSSFTVCRKSPRIDTKAPNAQAEHPPANTWV